MKIYTIGHGGASARSFFTALRESGAKRVVDVRRGGNARSMGYAKADDLEFLLEELCGMEYIQKYNSMLAPPLYALNPYRKGSIDRREFERSYEQYLKEIHAVGRARNMGVFDGGDVVLLGFDRNPDDCWRDFLAEHVRKELLASRLSQFDELETVRIVC